MNLGQHLAGYARLQLIKPLAVGLSLATDAKPLLVHVVLALHIVEPVAPVGPGSTCVVNIQACRLATFPPAVAELERETTEAVALTAHPGSIEIYLAPVVQQYLSLLHLGFALRHGVKGIGSELGEDNRLAKLLPHILEQNVERVAAIAVHSQDVYILALLGYDVDIHQVAVADSHRMRRVDAFNSLGSLVEQPVESPCLSIGQVAVHRNILSLGTAPEQSVVVFVPQQIEQHSGSVLIGADKLFHLTEQLLPHPLVAIVGMAFVNAVDHQSISSKRVVYHRVDAILPVDVLYPARRNRGILPDNVHSHTLQQRHLVLQCSLYHVVGLCP